VYKIQFGSANDLSSIHLQYEDRILTEEQFEANYPKEHFTYARKSFRAKGTMGQTEIEVFDIISKETGEVVRTATRTEHTNLRGLDTTVNWDW